MTDTEINKLLRDKYKKNPNVPSNSPRYQRKNKLTMRFGKSWESLTKEVHRTEEKLDLLMEIRREKFPSA